MRESVAKSIQKNIKRDCRANGTVYTKNMYRTIKRAYNTIPRPQRHTVALQLSFFKKNA